jgi:hypothetical protein
MGAALAGTGQRRRGAGGVDAERFERAQDRIVLLCGDEDVDVDVVRGPGSA